MFEITRKKVISFACAILVLFSSIQVLCMTSFGAGSQGAIVQSFEENYTYATSEVSASGFSLYTATGESDANVKDGTKSLKWQRANVGTCKITLWNSGKDLTVGTTYKMEMWVKSVKSDKSIISVTELSTRSNGYSDTGNPSFSIGPFNSNGEWEKVELIFTATKQANGLFIYNGTADSGDTLYFDAITWTPLDEVTVKLEPNNGETLADVTGMAGSEMTLPTVTKDGMDFGGWYIDAELTVPFVDANVFPNTNTTLYAKWLQQGTIVQDFEANYTYATSEVSETGFSLYEAASENDANVKDGSKSLKWQRASKGTCKITLWNSGKDLTVGTTYKMEMWVKSVKSDKSIISVTELSTRSNGYSDTGNPSFSIGPFNSNGEWEKVELVFTATKQANGLFIYNGTADSGDTLYFDAITWTPITEVTVKLKPNNGETIADIVGTAGSEMTLPTVTNGDMDFVGWYTDAELRTPLADVTVFPDVDTTLYAKWVKKGTIIQDFETNFTYATQGGFSLYTATNINDVNVKDGLTSLKWANEEGTKAITLWSSGKDLTVGTSYKMQFWVKAETSVDSQIFVTQLGTRSNGWTYTDNAQFKIGTFDSSYDSVGQWKKFEVTFTAATKATGLLIQSSGSDTFYFDAITWTPITEVTVKLEPNNGETLADVVGVSSTEMTLPTVTKAGMDFAGWYTDAELTTPLADTTVFPDVDTTLYAKWVTQGTVVQDFEANYTYATSEVSETGFSLYEAASENDANVKDGTKSLKWQRASKGTCKITLWNSGKDLTVGTTYKMEMWVKAENAENTVISVTQLSTRSNAWTDTNNTSFQIGPFTSSSEWKKVELTFTATTQANGLFIYNGTAGSPATFYFDAITWKPLEHDITVNIVTNNDDTVEAIKGSAGMSLTLPTLNKDGYYFAGWFSNSEFTDAFTSTKFPESSITLYAKWIKNGLITQNFESYDHNLSGEGFSLYTATTANDSNVYEGKHALYRSNYEKTRVAALSDQYVSLEVGKAYKFNCKIKVTSVGNEGGIQFINISDRKNAWSYSSMQQFKYISSSYDKLNEWTDATIYFVAENKYLGIASWGNITYYLDDVQVVEVPVVTVSFEMGEGAALAPISGAAGSTLKVENPTPPEGKSFGGWFLDANFNEAYKISNFPEQDITLYARWLNKGTYEQNFEVWPSVTGAFGAPDVFTLYTAKDANDPNVYNGRHSMFYSNTEKSNTFAVNIFDETMGKLEIGEKYTVSIRFKPVSTTLEQYDQQGTYHSIYYTTHLSNCWTWKSQGPQGRYKAYVFYEDSFNDEHWSGTANAVTTTTTKDENGWLNMTYEITAATPYIALYMNGYYSMYIDAIKIEVLPSGLVSSDYTKPYSAKFYNIINYSGFADLPNGTEKTIHKINVDVRSDYIFTASLKKGNVGSPKVYLAWDEKGENIIEGTVFEGLTNSYKVYSSRIMSDFSGVFYLVVEGGGKDSCDYFAFFPTQFAQEEDPNPDYVYTKTDYNSLPKRNADSDEFESGLDSSSPATGDHFPLAPLILLIAAAFVVLLFNIKKRGICNEK